DVIDRFSSPTSQEVELSILYSLKTKEFTIESEAGFSIPGVDLPLSDVKIKIIETTDSFDQMVYSVHVQGILSVGALPITLEFKYPGESDLFELKGSIPLSVNLTAFAGDCLKLFNLTAPTGLSELGALELTNASIKIVPDMSLFSAMITTSIGDVEFAIMDHPTLFVKEAEQTTEESEQTTEESEPTTEDSAQTAEEPEKRKKMMIVVLPMELDNVLSILGAPMLSEHVSKAVSDPVLFISTEEMKASLYESLQPLQTTSITKDIEKGINFQATFNDGLITDVLNVDSLKIAGSINPSPFAIKLDARSSLEVALVDFLILKGYLFGFEYEDGDYKVKVGAAIDLLIGEECLPLEGTISLETGPPPSLILSAYMREAWKDPFGLKGFTFDNLGVDLGFSLPLSPIVGFVAGVTLGSFSGSVALRVSWPTIDLLSIQFNELNIGTVVRSLLSAIAVAIPEPFIEFLEGISMEDVHFHYALDDITVGGVSYEKGLRMQAGLNLFGTRIFAGALLDPDEGMHIVAAIDPINISIDGLEIIKLTSASDSKKGAVLDLDIRKSSYNPHLIVNGAISIFGGFMKGLVDINIDQHGFDILAGCSIVDLFEASLDVRGPDIDNLFSGSGEGIYLKVYMKNDLLDYIRENLLKFIQDVTKSAVDGLTTAQNDLIKAQEAVVDWDKQIQAMIEIVEREQDAVIAGLVEAQNAVTAAQNEVNKIDGQINACYSRINTLNSQIRWWNNWYYSSPWWEKAWKWPQLVFEVGWRSAEITAQYVAIGALGVARVAAWAVLEVAKTALKIAQAIVVIADPALDPRVIALVAARAIAWAALKVAEGAIVVARAVVSGFSSLTQFVVEWGLGGVFNITSASFEANFTDVRNQTVELSADIVFMGLSSHIEFAFNFGDPVASVISFAEGLLSGAGIEVPP
ncbi:MAG: hypothetical protein ACFFE2_13595, partial [Candidatus Thorarchaeota archaeon]